MLPVAWDTETELIGAGRQAPALACTSFAYSSEKGLLHWQGGSREFFEEILYDDGYLLIGHNIAYDLTVVANQYPDLLPAIFRAYDEGRVRDTMIRQKLLDISLGCYRGYYEKPTKRERKKGLSVGPWKTIKYDLAFTYWRATNKRLDKDTWRLKYGELRLLPLKNWPEGAKVYPVDDAVATKEIYEGQEEVAARVNKNLSGLIKNPDVFADEPDQVRAAFWIYLMKTWGIKTRPDRVRNLFDQTEEALEEVRESLKNVRICPECGVLVVHDIRNGMKSNPCGHLSIPRALIRPDNSKDTVVAKARMIWAMGGRDKVRRTDKGAISLDEDACKASDDPFLQEYQLVTSLGNVMSKDIPALMKGRFMPIHSNFDSLVGTGRTSSAAPNIQNIRRLPGIRECFVPRDGHVFLDCDYDGLELRTLGQTCLKLVGFSKLADTLNDGKDVHLAVAAQLLDISYEDAFIRYDLVEKSKAEDEEIEEARQLAKVANFGFPGGLGFEALISFAKGYGVKNLTEQKARELKASWMAAFPEMEQYFGIINDACAEDRLEGLAHIEHLFSRRIRGKIKYTVACNSFFQGLGSDATKRAGWLIAKACYVDEKSPLFGCRIVNYIHDQFLVEAPEAIAHEACMELVRLMIEGAAPYLPDVPATVSKPMVTRCWSKKAKQLKDKDGRLIPWDMEYEVKKKSKTAAA